MKQLLRYRVPILVSLAVLLLLCKYLWSLWLFPDVPFGYDAGIYRYLFLVHARAWPPFVLTSLPEWAKAHPLGLFFFSSLLLKVGVPADWLIGWVWNLFPVFLALVVARIAGRSFGWRVAVGVLLAALLSVVQYDGFLQMYWKVLVALLWCALAFDAFERRSPLVILYGMFAVATHQQIGLLYGLAIASSLAVSAVMRSDERGSLFSRTLPFVLSCVFGALWYLPNAQRSIVDILPLLHRGGALALAALGACVILGIVIFLRRPTRASKVLLWSTAIVFLVAALPIASVAPGPLARLMSTGSTTPGVFLSVQDYISASFPLLILGVLGWYLLFKKRPASPWLWAAAWSVLAVVSMFFFYRRFLLPLDFFLLLPAGIALAWLAQEGDLGLRILTGVLVALQIALLIMQMAVIDPHIDATMLRDFHQLSPVVPKGATVVVLDNMAPWVAGYLPDATVSGPGIFDSLPLADWQKFLLGGDAERRGFFAHYAPGTYFLATDVFRQYYAPEVTSLLEHPCLHPESFRGLYRLDCSTPRSPSP
jgi:hypothetical protein